MKVIIVNIIDFYSGATKQVCQRIQEESIKKVRNSIVNYTSSKIHIFEDSLFVSFTKRYRIKFFSQIENTAFSISSPTSKLVDKINEPFLDFKISTTVQNNGRTIDTQYNKSEPATRI